MLSYYREPKELFLQKKNWNRVTDLKKYKEFGKWGEYDEFCAIEEVSLKKGPCVHHIIIHLA